MVGQQGRRAGQFLCHRTHQPRHDDVSTRENVLRCSSKEAPVRQPKQPTEKLVGSKKQEAKGLEKQLEGKVQQKVGDLKAAVEDATKS